MAIREGRWDCVACGRTANLGRDLRCAGCGRARGKVKFYLPANEPAVREAEMLAMAKAGPDWVCGYCEASNRSTSQACTGCGAPRAEGTSRVRGGSDADEGVRPPPPAAAGGLRTGNPGRKLAVAWVIVGLLLSCCGGGTLMTGFSSGWGGERGVGGPSFRLGAPSGGAEVTLETKRAVREVDVEENRLVQDESWCSAMPRDAAELSRRSKKSGTRTVCRAGGTGREPLLGAAVPGLFRTQEDLGNGFFDDGGSGGGGSGWDSGSSSSDNCTTVDEYADWCTWEAWRWVVVETASNEDFDVTPAWPAVELRPGQRQGRRRERFEGIFRSTDGEHITLHVNEERWLAWEQGASYEGTWSFFGGLKAVGPAVSTAERAARP